MTEPNILYGQIGHFLVVTSFVMAFVASVSYFMSIKTNNSGDVSSTNGWLKLGRFSFVLHFVGVIGAVSILFMMLYFHMFEYEYIWKHSSKDLPLRYILSSFWEGQEGSTFLWLFWHAVLGIILINKAKKWEPSVMGTLAAIQVMLLSMELGVFVFDYKIGNSAFMLMRDSMDLPIFKMNENYIPEDGRGLNPLLQNYWMTIHPPTLFLGFALSSIPFCYSVGSLIHRDYKDYIQDVYGWLVAAIIVLGIGIMLGGAWAYEALSFGGFWAWDPVENASFVPWLVLLAGLHTLVIYKSTGRALTMTYIFLGAGFLLILYSSFLTKSGILGDSSVHSFTDMGMSGLLVVTILVFLIPFIYLLIKRRKEIPSLQTEELASSREFWMFLGALVLIFSAFHIIMVTSFPVFNKLFSINLAPPSNIISHYNNVQIWIAILIGFFSGIAYFLKYKKTKISKAVRMLLPMSVVSILLGLIVFRVADFKRIDYLILLVSGFFAVISNSIFVLLNKNSFFKHGGAITHIGFGIFIIGVLISQGKQTVISQNKYGIDYGENFDMKTIAENVLLYKNEPITMNNYEVTYISDSTVLPNIYFNVHYKQLDNNGNAKREFTLQPNIQINPMMGNVANPSTRRSLFGDLYTHITGAPLKDDGTEADSLIIDSYQLKVGDTIQANRVFGVLRSITPLDSIEGVETLSDDIIISANIELYTLDSSYLISPKYFIRGNMATSIPERIKNMDMRISLSKIMPEEKAVEITIEQIIPKYIIMKAIHFPFINLMWGGAFITFVGMFTSLFSRRRKKLVATSN